MRKISILAGLALALSLGGAGVASAQSAAARPQHERGQRGPDMLFKGINLSADQKARVKTLREQQHKQMEAQRENNKDNRSAQRQRGDTTGFGARRAQMEQRREQQYTQLRSILDGDQRVQFDKNVAEMKARFAQRGNKGDHKRKSGDGDTNQSR